MTYKAKSSSSTSFTYPKAIQDAVTLLCEELQKYYPFLKEMELNPETFKTNDGETSFRERMEAACFMEVMKDGILFNKIKE